MSFGGDRGQIMTDELKRVSSLRGLWRAYLRVGLMRVRLPTEYGKNPLLVDLREMEKSIYHQQKHCLSTITET